MDSGGGLALLRFGDQRKAERGLVWWLEERLNKPIVVLVAGVVAVVLNVLLYFGLFLPRMTPLIAYINPIDVSSPGAIGESAPEVGGESGLERSVGAVS